MTIIQHSEIACTLEYDVTKSTLQNCRKGIKAQRDMRPNGRKLTDTEESTLVEWILSIDQRGLAPAQNCC